MICSIELASCSQNFHLKHGKLMNTPSSIWPFYLESVLVEKGQLYESVVSKTKRCGCPRIHNRNNLQIKADGQKGNYLIHLASKLMQLNATGTIWRPNSLVTNTFNHRVLHLRVNSFNLQDERRKNDQLNSLLSQN